MRSISILIILAAAALLPGAAAAGQQSTEARLAAVEAAQQAILKELQEIKALLMARPPTPARPPAAAVAPAAAPPAIPPFDLSVAASPAKGRSDAPLVIVEFSDFECPFCGRYSRDTFAQVERDYVDTGKVRYVFRHFPLERIHPQALGASKAAECAFAQGKFWELHARLFANQRALKPADLTASAQAVGVNIDAFQACMATAGTPARIRLDLDEGGRAGISGTPTFFLGTMTRDGKVKVARRLVGAQPFSAFKTVIDAMLAAPPRE